MNVTLGWFRVLVAVRALTVENLFIYQSLRMIFDGRSTQPLCLSQGWILIITNNHVYASQFILQQQTTKPAILP